MTIRQIQCLLAYLGYDPGTIDGAYGPRTRAAVKAFQQAEGLDPDGIAGQQTAAKLREAVFQGRVYVPPDASGGTVDKQDEVTGTFWDRIKYFTRAEFKCKCGGRFCNGYPAEMQEAVVKIADAARAHFGRPAHVISGLRCKQWNAHEGGVANSQHMYGEAIDLRIDGVDSETLRQFVASQPGHRYSYCINSTNVHFDINKVGR